MSSSLGRSPGRSGRSPGVDEGPEKDLSRGVSAKGGLGATTVGVYWRKMGLHRVSGRGGRTGDSSEATHGTGSGSLEEVPVKVPQVPYRRTLNEFCRVVGRHSPRAIRKSASKGRHRKGHNDLWFYKTRLKGEGVRD